jgi:hypothetical protein
MFDKLHLLSQDVPDGGQGVRWRKHPYLRITAGTAKGPAVFDWDERQRRDLEALWRDPAADGARERLARDLAAFCDKLGWRPDATLLEDADRRGEEYMLTLSAVPPELYILPWEVIQIGASGKYLSDHASAQVRYTLPGLEPRTVQPAPPAPGVLFGWSAAGGAVPHEEHAAAIRAAAEAGGVVFRELADGRSSARSGTRARRCSAPTTEARASPVTPTGSSSMRATPSGSSRTTASRPSARSWRVTRSAPRRALCRLAPHRPPSWRCAWMPVRSSPTIS